MNSRYGQYVRIFAFGLVISFFIGLIFIKLSKNWLPAISGKSVLIDSEGDAVGGDFIVFYAASSLALSGKSADIYEPSVLQNRIDEIIGKKLKYYWFYPPTFLLVLLPLAKMPYFISFIIWTFFPLLFYLMVIFRIAPLPATIPLAFCFPGTSINLSCGQNGFLSATLLGWGLIFLDKFPRLSGFLLGLLTYKPHLAVLIPVVLIAGRRWQALVTFFLITLLFALSSLLIFGSEVWQAFFHILFHPAQRLQDGAWDWAKMPTVFAAVFLMGGNLITAYIMQTLTMLGVAAAVVMLWLKDYPIPHRNAGLVLAILLFTPYAFQYDLPLLALAIAWLAWRGYAVGLTFMKKALFFCAWLSPFINKLPITIFTVFLLFLVACTKDKILDDSSK